MDALLRPLVALGRDGLARGRAAARRYSMAGLCGALAVIAAIGAVGLSLAALWTFLLPRVGSAGALLILAAVLAVLCLALLVAARAIVRATARVADAEPAVRDPLLAVADLFNDHKGSVFLAALAAGMCAGIGTRGQHR